MKPTLLILAAGMGSRFGGLKQVEPVGPSGETILEYSIFDAVRAGFGKVVFVIREHFQEAFKAHFEPRLKKVIATEYVFQEIDYLPEGFSVPEGREKPWGTGHAILMAAQAVKEPFAVINADDFYGEEAFLVMASFLKNSCRPNQYAMVGYQLGNTLSDFGSVSRGICQTDSEQNLQEIKERTKIIRQKNEISYEEEGTSRKLQNSDIASMNFWGFHPSIFGYLDSQFISFLQQQSHLNKSEFYIPAVVYELIKTGGITTKILKADSSWFGVTYPEDKPFVADQLKKLVRQGVYPSSLW